jgi:hypothetical protein
VSKDVRIKRRPVAKSALAVNLILALHKPATPQTVKTKEDMSYACRRFYFKAKNIDKQTFSGNPPICIFAVLFLT